MIRRLLRALVLLVAVFGILPGSSLLMEHALELVSHGHPAHSVVGEVDVHASEHGCAAGQHACPCHESQATAAPSKAEAGARPAVRGMTSMVDDAEALRERAVLNWRVDGDRTFANRSTAPPVPPARG